MNNIRPANLINIFTSKRFLPYFSTLFLGAFNDNIYKQCLFYIITFQLLAWMSNVDANLFNNLAAGIFIIPYVLFSYLAGQLADKYEKSLLIKRLKNLEIGIMCLAFASFYFQSFWGLIAALLLTGLQSAFFSPIKYSILPQHLHNNELLGGNSLVEMGTYVAIILGTIIAGVLVEIDAMPIEWLISGFIIVIAISGRTASQFIPEAAAANPELKIDFNGFRQTGRILKNAYRNKLVFKAMLGVCMFWFLGVCLMTQLPNLVKSYFNADESTMNLLLTLFSISIGLGSILCNTLSKGRINLKLVAFAALGLGLAYVDFAFAAQAYTNQHSLSVSEFVSLSHSWRLMADILFIGLFAGLFVVPLMTLIQTESEISELARMVAANNILNAAAMVIASIAGIVCLSVLTISIPNFFLIIAGIQLIVAALIWAWVYSHSPKQP